MLNLSLKEVGELNTLFRKYVSTRRAFNLLELYGCVRRETKLAEIGEIRVTRELLRELRRDRAFVGHCARRAIGRNELKNPFAPFANYVEWMLNSHN